MTWIDDSNRDRHHFLSDGDQCLFFGEFFSNKGFAAGPTNQLIKNYKRTPVEIAASTKATQLQYYKDKAVSEVAAGLRGQFSPVHMPDLTFVPLPSSKVVGDPEYCDRLERTLRQAFTGVFGYQNVDIRPLLRQTRSTVADHKSGGDRIKYDELLEITEIDPAQLQQPVRKQIILFDDVITSGKHYKVAKTRLHEIFPNHPIIGVFIARAVHPDPFDDFEDLTQQ